MNLLDVIALYICAHFLKLQFHLVIVGTEKLIFLYINQNIC